MSTSILQRRPLYLAIALLFFTYGQVVAQATAGQTISAIPQQIKTNAEVKANTKANSIANSATDKLDSGMNKAFKGIGKMFKKKPKPGKESVSASVTPVVPVTPATPVTPVAPVVSKTDTTGGKKSSFLSGGKTGLAVDAGWCNVIEAWAREGRKSKTVFLKTA